MNNINCDLMLLSVLFILSSSFCYRVSPIYSQELIEQAKLSPEFGREYELQYLGLVGNVFSQASIENCQKIAYDIGGYSS